MSNKIILPIILVLIALLAIGLGWYFMSQKKSFSPLAPSSPDLSSGAPQLPTVEMPKTNPFEGVRFNPFE